MMEKTASLKAKKELYMEEFLCPPAFEPEHDTSKKNSYNKTQSMSCCFLGHIC